MNNREIVVREGLPFILVPGAAALIAFLAGAVGIFSLFFIITVFVVWFFRNPERTGPVQEGLIVSPADGRIIGVERGATSEYVPGSFTKISIFMNVFNVHVNRVPSAGAVSAIRYRPGKFFSADLDKASAFNERNAVVIAADKGRSLVVVQIAGLIARRIVCWVTEGMTLRRGERFGLIRFGSRVEVFLPDEAMVFAQVGNRVRAGETTIGEWP
jgi:phosphatidylserine decarboxylase